MHFRILGEIGNVEVIARGEDIFDLARLARVYGEGQWIKCKGTANVELVNGIIVRADLHWYELHGVGRREFKIKRLLEHF